MRLVTVNGILEHLRGDVKSEATAFLPEYPAADITKASSA
jgi:hypothetical protein